MIDFVIRWRWPVIIERRLLVAWVFFPWNRLVTQQLPDGQAQDRVRSASESSFPYQNLGSEFMPPLYEGDLLYMPTTFPGISPTKAREILQQTDKIIKTFPEVHHVFGKIGRAETATDPAPLDMVETTIMLKEEKEWPASGHQGPNGKVIAHRRRTPDELADAMNAAIQIPGLNNAWTMPIKTRIDMLATGIKTPVGIKVAGADLAELERVARRSKRSFGKCPARRAYSPSASWAATTSSSTSTAMQIARYGSTVGRRAGRAGGGARRDAAHDHGRGLGALQR